MDTQGGSFRGGNRPPGPPTRRVRAPNGGDPRGADVEIPSFAVRLIEWVREPMDELWSKRTRREMLETNWNIAAARAAVPAPAAHERGKTIRIPLGPADAKTPRAAAKTSGASLNEWARRVLLNAARDGGRST